jgi:tryptophan synthase alpha chain
MRISERFKELEARGEKALILYISCGDPSADETVKIADGIIKAGCDILELGLPFSDPIADGPTIQAASQRALKAGMNTDRYFEVAKRIPNKIPKVCMTYYNLILQYGLDNFCRRCGGSGISGLIIPDLPLEESGELQKQCEKHSIDLIFIVSPMTPKDRLRDITRASKGFIYLQSVLGVTGARGDMEVRLGDSIGEIKRLTKLPVAVGFGISKPEQVKQITAQGADGIIIGSALIKKIREDRKHICEYVESLKSATK